MAGVLKQRPWSLGPTRCSRWGAPAPPEIGSRIFAGSLNTCCLEAILEEARVPGCSPDWIQGFPREEGVGEKDRNKERDKERILQLRK